MSPLGLTLLIGIPILLVVGLIIGFYSGDDDDQDPPTGYAGGGGGGYGSGTAIRLLTGGSIGGGI